MPEIQMPKGLGAIGLARRHALWLAAGVAVAVTVGLWLSLRQPPPRIAPPAMEHAGAAPVASPSPSTVFVDVGGAVRHPGLYELPLGSRVADALEAAGGARRNANMDLLNLAQLLTDGMKIQVAAQGEAGEPTAATGGPSAAPGLIDINTADETLLETIPGIGPVTAAAIIAYRAQSGPFGSVDELMDVTGIGPATLESLRPYVTI